IYSDVQKIPSENDHFIVIYYDIRAAHEAKRSINGINIWGVQIHVDFKQHQINSLDLMLKNRSEVIPHFYPKNITMISSGNRAIAEKNNLDIERIKN
ncbi:21654_t:CDS:2, partial [Dentiscutata erythropus]